MIVPNLEIHSGINTYNIINKLVNYINNYIIQNLNIYLLNYIK